MDLSRPLAVVTPTLDGDVLNVLAHADATFTASRVHALLPTRTKRGIDKVLARLVAQGIVEQAHAGRPSLYRLNRDHLACAAIIGLAHQKEALVANLRSVVAGWTAAPVFAALFGSAARGAHTTASDIDLLLVHADDVDEQLWREQVDRLSAMVTRWTGNDLRAVSFSESEVAASAPDDPLFQDVVRDGVAFAGEPDWLARSQRRGA